MGVIEARMDPIEAREAPISGRMATIEAPMETFGSRACAHRLAMGPYEVCVSPFRLGAAASARRMCPTCGCAGCSRGGCVMSGLGRSLRAGGRL